MSAVRRHPPRTETGASAATAPARDVVARNLEKAGRLGERLADLVNDPTAFVAALRAGYTALADPVYRDAQAWVAPGSGPVFGVRAPLQRATWRSLRRRTRGVRASSFLFVAEALLRDGAAEPRLLALEMGSWILADEPERTWQLLRRTAREAHEWITVDTLAHPYAAGILREPYRWAELEQLTYSPSRWERRLVGSTIATMPFVDRAAGRTPAVVSRGLGLIGELIGDADPEVNKSLAWALRNLAAIDPAAVTAFARDQAAEAVATGDPHRARVVRGVLVKLPPAAAADLRARLATIKVRRNAPTTSRAAATAAAFAANLGGALPRPADHPEPPLR